MSTVKTTGRLVYIEPNDLVGLDGIKGADGTKSSDGVSWNAEELNMSVDLQVIIPNREDCGQVSFNKTFLVNINNDKSSEIGKYVSFLSGSDIHRSDEITSHELTTSYVDASYQEIKNNHKSNKECLGIESIDITFDSHFYPNVNIKFVDVRGYSLMMPTEEQYKDSIDDKKNGTNKAGAYTNFFRALFHFPYPRFLLTVKGYYGNSITFMLAPNEFHNQFNSSTGNFEINVSFIGYMYGLYTDLPFNLLMCAPYLGVDTADGETKGKYWTDGNYQFTDENGNANGEVQTYVDFIKSCDALARVKQQIQEGTSDNDTVNEASKLNQEDSNWQEIIDKIHSFLDKGIEPNKIHTVLKQKNANGQVTDVLVLGKKDEIINYDANAWKSIAQDLNKSLSSLKTLMDIFDTDFANSATDMFDEAPKLKIFDRTGNNTDVYNYLKNYFPQICKQLDEKPVRKKYQTRLIELSPLFDGINKRRNNIANQINSNSPEIQAEVQQVYSTSLGFDPTIQNIYRMLFAHIDCFMQSFYDLLGKIKSSNRKLKDIGISDKNLTDLNRKSTADAFVPPFTAFFKMNGNKREMVYPKDLGGSVKLDEVDYIENLLQGVLSAKINVLKYLAQASTAEQYNNELQQGAGGGGTYAFEPTCITDLWRNGGNPYANLRSDPNNNDKYLAELVYYFTLRQVAASAQGFNTDISEIEAKNFVNLHKQIPGEKFKQQLEACKNDDNAIKELLKSIEGDSNLVCKPYEKDDTWYITRPTPLYIDGFKKNDARASYIKNKDKDNKLFAILDESHNDEITKFREQISNNTLKNSIDLTSQSKITYNDRTFYNISDFLNYDIATKLSDENLLIRLIAIIVLIHSFNNGETKYKNTRITKTIIYDVLFVGAILKYPKIFNKKDASVTININNKEYKTSYVYERYLEGRKINGYKTFYDDFLVSSDFKIIKGWLKNKKNYGENNIFTTNITNQIINYFNKIISIVNIESKDDINYGPKLVNIKKFLSTISDAYNSGEGGGVTAEEQAIQNIEDIKASDLSETHKLAVYNTLKNLYDKWANSYTKEDFQLREPSSDYSIKKSRYETGNVDFSNDTKEFDNFLFVDSYYNDISNKYRINPRTVYDLVRTQMEGSSNYSTYEFMADLCQKNDLLFLALPVYNNFYTVEGIQNIFNPQIEQSMKTGFGSTYICMHTYEVSHVVEDESDTGLCDDGIDIAAITDDSAPMDLKQLFDHSGNGLSLQVPAFGVTYALQSQQYFKTINVNMDNPRVTDYSIQNTLMLASPGSDNTLQKPAMAANDLYSIYANRSYNCTVDMMGCANIMPMMYFQLNNIPMFRGGYMITNVSHHIAPGDFTTTFTGVRISKNQLPFNDEVFNLNSLLNLEGGMMGTAGCVGGVSCTGSFDPQKAVARMGRRLYLNLKNFKGYVTPLINEKYHGGCATSVQYFLCAGFGYGDSENDRTSHGYCGCDGFACKQQIIGRGFNIIKTITNKTRQEIMDIEKTIQFLPGDIAVMDVKDHDKHPYGHICMYSGNEWVSDAKQARGATVYNGMYNEITFLRFKGCSSSGSSCSSNTSMSMKPLPINVSLGIGYCNGEKGGLYNPSHMKVQPKINDTVSTYHLAGLKLGFTGTYLQSLVKVIEQVWRYYNRDNLRTLYHIVGNWNIGNPNATKKNPVVPNANVDYYRASVSRYMQMSLKDNITFNENTICKLVEVMCMIERATNVTKFSHQAYKAAQVPH